MLPQERYESILKLFTTTTIVKVEDLMKEFGVSVETARRDLNFLEKEGLIKKIYGGATLINKAITEPLSNDRLTSHLLEKESIGKKCSEFINDGDSVLIEIGTTTLQVAKAIRNKKKLNGHYKFHLCSQRTDGYPY
ncbi:MAG: DeoR/GlpR family DNA-binding transcription regulator [Anaerovorax sp.]